MYINVIHTGDEVAESSGQSSLQGKVTPQRCWVHESSNHSYPLNYTMKVKEVSHTNAVLTGCFIRDWD